MEASRVAKDDESDPSLAAQNDIVTQCSALVQRIDNPEESSFCTNELSQNSSGFTC
jgi:hypothetical protein